MRASQGLGEHRARDAALRRGARAPASSRRGQRRARGALRSWLLVERHDGRLGRLGVSFTMAVRTGNEAVAKAIAAIDEAAWTPIEYTDDGVAEVAETTDKGRRLVVRRTRLLGPDQKLWPEATRRVPHRPRRHGCRARRLPSRPRPRRARDQGPEGGGWDGARPLRPVLRERRLALLRGARARPRAVEFAVGRPRERGNRRRHPHRGDPAPRPPCAPRQPLRCENPAHARAVAMGRHLRAGARQAPGDPRRVRLSSLRGPAQPQTPTDAPTTENDTDPWLITPRCRLGMPSRRQRPRS